MEGCIIGAADVQDQDIWYVAAEGPRVLEVFRAVGSTEPCVSCQSIAIILVKRTCERRHRRAQQARQYLRYNPG